MKIRNIEYNHGVFLAPMAGVTDKSFRFMCKKYFAEGMTTEMISSRALVFNDKKTKEMAIISDFERPCALQIFGNDPETIAKAAILAMEFNPDIIDINMGCPTPKIVNNGDGCALMKTPSLCYDIVKEVVLAIEDKIPITVKIRMGFDKNNINAAEVAIQCEQAGASAICVHARTREQMYSSPIFPEIVKKVKESVSIPVIGNGDIYNANDAIEMFEKTNCDGIMVGRGALGNPYIFENIIRKIEGKEEIVHSSETIKNDIKLHFGMLLNDKGEYVGIREARKHIAWYIKGRPNSASIRDEVNRALSVEKIIECVNSAFEE